MPSVEDRRGFGMGAPTRRKTRLWKRLAEEQASGLGRRGPGSQRIWEPVQPALHLFDFVPHADLLEQFARPAAQRAFFAEPAAARPHHIDQYLHRPARRRSPVAHQPQAGDCR